MPAAPSRERTDILIAGASFAGLALARALISAFGCDIRVTIVDRAARKETRGPDARAFALSAGARRMLDTLGIWQAVAASAEPVTDIEITDSNLDAGVRPVLLHYDNRLDGNDGTSEPATHIVPAHELEQALWSSVASDPSLTLLAPAEILTFTDAGSATTAVLADGREIAAPLLVGAEGRRSPSRDGARIGTVGWRYGQTALVTTIAHDRPHGGRAIQHFLPAGPFAILPLPGNRSCLTWTEDAEEAKRIMALDDAGFLVEIETRVAGRLGTIEVVGPRQTWPLEMHLARAYVAPRFALIGDAAHGVHPIAGQGANLAFRDAAALSEVIADAMRLGLDPGSMQILSRYQTWRRFDSFASAATFDGLNKLFSNDNTFVRAARDFGLGVVERLPAVKRALVSEAAGVTGDLPRLFKSERL
ncbi:MAG: FAD-dependent monooxygenase [Hyphomicrobium sp.]|uniref:FAD-dependent monooxygenase n=1 Tax=Hyphomicrobium sp. TaxID=82 RepID=UPI003D1229D6